MARAQSHPTKNLEKNNQENLCLNKNLIRELFIAKKNAAFFGKNLLEDEDSTDPDVIIII